MIRRVCLALLVVVLSGVVPAAPASAELQPPGSVTTSPYGTGVFVSFTVGSPGPLSAICESSTGGSTRGEGGQASPIYVQDLTGGHTYTCRVRVGYPRYEPGEAYSEPSAPFVAGLPYPPAVTSVQPGWTTASVHFVPGLSSGLAPSEYKVRCDSTTGGTARATTGTTSPLTVQYLSSRHSYTCAVRAVNAVGVSAYSEPSTAFETAPSPPLGPTAVDVSNPTASTIDVYITPGSNQGSPVTSYEARCDSANGGTARKVTGPSRSITVRYLTPGRTYTCRARATNALGTSPYSAPSSTISTVGTPSAPSGVVAAPSGTSALVGFASGADGGAPITSFQARCDSYTGGKARAATGSSSPITVPYLTSGHGYTCRVRATNVAGVGPFSVPSAAFATP